MTLDIRTADRIKQAVKNEVDRLPKKRFGLPWNRWNYVRRVDVYDAIDRAVEHIRNIA